MLIYNTLSRKKEEFRPINPDFVTMYVCGPTVYDFFHIGNARSFIMADIIRRYLEYKGFKVKFTMNITDVDDNIIKKSIQEKKPASEVAAYYAQAFFEDLKKLKVSAATFNPKATNHIETMINLISDLEKKGIAYNVNGNVFFDVSKFNEYGKLSGKNINELEAGARIEINDEKKNPLDFALWKKAKEGEPSWDSPWGKGRPGWHIECSAMSTTLLGKTIDIHAGGNDLIFPHHENEIAQSESAFEQKFVNYWMHFGFLNIQNEKMSKSLGNFFTAREILTKYSAEAIRLFFSQTYYGGPLNFSDELLDSAQKGVEKIINLAEKIEHSLKVATDDGVNPDFNFQKYYDDFAKVMDDDFNTPQGVAVIFDFVKAVNKIISDNEKIKIQFFVNAKKFLKDTADDVLGIISFEQLGKSSEGILEDDLIKLLIEVRETLKKEKNFSLADQIRNDLNKLGIILEDSKSGTTFKKR
ncbi:MAG: cysteine--tRNA ligase [Bacteroidetes bacterium]|nr:cysteine--tRNA ligase [Bacteroidota bacterium]